MFHTFKNISPGLLTIEESREINRALELLEQWVRLTVEPPLVLDTTHNPYLYVASIWDRKIIVGDPSDDAAIPPQGIFVPPRITVPGPPSWPNPVSCSIVCDSNGVIWIYGGGSWININSGSLDVREVDLSPSYTGITTLEFDQADGFVVSNPSANVARIKLSSGSGTDEKAKVSSNDTTSDYLINKLTAGDGLKWTEVNDAGDEDYKIEDDPDNPGCKPCWKKITKSYTDWSDSISSKDISIYTLAAGGCLHDLIVKHTTAFTGGTITDFGISVGVSGDLVKYATSKNVFSTPIDQDATVGTRDNSSAFADVPDWGSTTDIRAEASATGDTLDNATAGVIEFHLLVSQPKS